MSNDRSESDSCKLIFGSDFHSCSPYFRSDISPVKNNLGVILTLACLFARVINISMIKERARVLSEILNNSLELIVL